MGGGGVEKKEDLTKTLSFKFPSLFLLTSIDNEILMPFFFKWH